MVASAATLKAARQATGQRRYGCNEPRVWTPPLRELTRETSLGFWAVDFARDVCGISLFPWQEWVLIHMLELAGDLTVSTDAFGRVVVPRRDAMEPLFRFRRYLLLVARQNGKSTLSQVLALFFLYALGVDLILGTAQDLDTAEEVWDGVLDVIDETPDLAALADKPIRVNGKKTIRLKTGERYKVKAANRKAGRGLSGDLILLDELREHQTWDAWAAITKTANARAAAFIFAMSNAGDAMSVVLRWMRMAAHAELGDPDGINAAEQVAALEATDGDLDTAADLVEGDASDGHPDDLGDGELADPKNLGIAEFSAPPGCDVTDIAGILQANPSIGHGIAFSTVWGDALTEGKSSATEWLYRTEVLCQWPDGAVNGLFPSGSWERTMLRPTPSDLDGAGGLRLDSPLRIASEKVDVCIDVSWDRSRSYIAICGENRRGQTVCSIAKALVGVDGLRPWIIENAHRIRRLTGQAKGAQVSDLLALWEQEPGFPVPIERWQGGDLIGAYGQAFDAVRDGTVWHTEQPVLDAAESGSAKKDLGDGWVINRRASRGDSAPMVAWVGALWLHRKPPPKSAPPPPPPKALKIPTAPEKIRRRAAAPKDLARMGF